MPELIRIRAQPLSADAFRPFGQVLEPLRPVYPEVDDGSTSVMMLNQKRRSSQIEMMAFHGSYNQTFIPIRGSMIFVLAPPPPELSVSAEECGIEYGKVAAFIVETGQAIFINRGVGHNSIPVGSECLFVSVTKKHGEEIDPVVDYVEGRSGKMENSKAIEYVNFCVRDGKIIELEI